jgi:recombination protein RecT
MSKKQLTLKDQFSAIKPRFIDLTNPETYEKEVSFALQHINKNPALKKASTESKLEAVMNVAQVGLTLNPVLKLAYLVPRSEYNGSQWITKACLEPSYQGLCKLITDTGSAKQIYSQLIYEGDEFEIILGTSPEVIHKPRFKSKDIIGAYMVAILTDGLKHVEFMTLEDLNEIRERSESYKAFKSKKIKSCVWSSDFGEMARKTVIRRGVKYLPKTDLFDKLGAAIQLDEQDYTITSGQQDTIESLLLTANITHEAQQQFFRELPVMNASRAREVIDYLSENQIDPITAGNNYSQSDINNKIKNEI